MKSQVGILIPIYNGMPFLLQAVESILCQSVGAFDLYLVDDGSTDGSHEWLQGVNDPRITKLYNADNKGLYPTLADTLVYLENEWVVILMQDDCLASDYLSEFLALAKRMPHLRAFWGAQAVIDEQGRVLQEGLRTGRIEEILPHHDAWYSGLRRGCFWTISGSFTKRELFCAAPFRTDLPHAADYEWLLRMLRQEPLVYYERPLIRIRQHAQQASTRNLADARDVVEYLKIHHAQVLAHKNELTLPEVRALGVQRLRLIARRILRSVRHRDLQSFRVLSRCAWGYIGLMIEFQRAR